MNKINASLITSIIFLFFCFNASSQKDNWEVVISDGFNNSCNLGIIEFEEFKGYLYAGTMLTTSTNCQSAELWRSPNGETGSWERISDFTPSLTTRGIPSFGKTDLDGGIFWLGSTIKDQGTLIYRSIDGQKWTAISKYGFGNKLMTVPSPHMVVFQGSMDTIPYLYAGTGSHGGSANAQLWRIPYNSTDSLEWELVLDFKNINTNVSLIAYLYIWNGKLYFTTDGWAQLWESSDGTNFQMNQYVDYGFGVSSNYVLSSMADFNGSLYITTTNFMEGGQLWKSSDGITWDSITLNAFGKNDSVTELRSLRVSFDRLWLTSYTDTQISKGNAIWYSIDGSNFIQSNTDGFENMDNNGPNAVVFGFGDYEYYGGPNYSNGAQLWRAFVADTNSSSIREIDETISEKTFRNLDDLFTTYDENSVQEVLVVDIFNRILYHGSFDQNLITNCIQKVNSGIYFLKVHLIRDQDIIYKFKK